MIKVWFGFDGEAMSDPSPSFDGLCAVYADSWFSDEFVKKMVNDIDRSKVLSPRCIESPVFGQISPRDLSGGLKACILLYELYYDDDLYIDLTACGENCVPWLAEIFAKRDCTVSCSTFDLSFKGYDISGVCLNDGSEIKNWMDFSDKRRKFIREVRNGGLG